MIELRPHQSRAVGEVMEAWRQGAQRVCMVMPTGGGKTITAQAIAEAAGGRALWLVHRAELAAQAPGRAVTIQGLVASRERPECDVLIADECHHLAPGAEQWHAVAKDYPRILGLTATPERHDGSALGDLFDRLVVGAHYSELLEAGFLVPVTVFRPKEELAGGIAEAPEVAWRRLAGDLRGFAFFSKVVHAQKFTEAMNAGADLLAPPVAATIWGDMPEADRASTLRRFKAGLLKCLSNVQVLTEGVDVPEAAVCLLATGCDHAGAYLQRVGRVTRPFPGKLRGILIDLPGSSHRFGLPTEDREYALDGRPIKCKVEPLRVCQKCGCTYPSAEGACPACGFLPPPQKARLRILHMTLDEVISSKEATPKQRQIAKAVQKKTEAMSHEELAKLYRDLVERGARRGYRPGWAKYQYHLRTGRWPSRGML